MPLNDEENVNDVPVNRVKSVSSTQSMFDKKNTSSKEAFEKKVENLRNKSNSYKEKAADLAIQFKKILDDKTLPSNKNPFSISLEKETLSKMIELAVEINNDENEKEGMGSLSWITLLFKAVLFQRDKINLLEYELGSAQKKMQSFNDLEIKLNEEIIKIHGLLANKLP